MRRGGLTAVLAAMLLCCSMAWGEGEVFSRADVNALPRNDALERNGARVTLYCYGRHGTRTAVASWPEE